MTTALYRSSTTRTTPPRTLNGRSLIPSGRGWAARFPVSTTTRELTQPFRGNAERFLDALRRAGAGIIISSTLRTKEHRVGASYGVIKYNRSGRDDPHWSDNGA